MERCERGPCLVVYPEAVWYRYESNADIDAIIDEHIVGGQPVERLRI
jgi:(2Fe-2S) ferredoxin